MADKITNLTVNNTTYDLADSSAIKGITLGGAAQTVTEGVVNLPSYPDTSDKMDKNNPTGTGTFSFDGNANFSDGVTVGTDQNKLVPTITLTQAEYDALGDEKLTNGIVYYISDAEGGGGGSDVEYSPVFTNGTTIGNLTIDGEDNPIIIPEVILTQAEYDALGSEKYTDGINYFISDASGGGGGASSWDELTDKPFESIGNTLSIDANGVLNTKLNYSVRKTWT